MNRINYVKEIPLSEISLTRLYEAGIRRIHDLPHRLSWSIPFPQSRYYKEKLRSFYNIHRGERCFIIANGPSLKNTDLVLLQNDITIGMNRIHLSADSLGLNINYLVVTDVKIQLEQFPKEYNEINCIKFFNWNARRLFPKDEKLHFLKTIFRPHFSKDITEGIWNGHSVTYACLQLAFYMGFTEVILIGKDHNYEQKGVPGQILKSDGNESNHFIKGYYTKNMIWRIPDYKGEELGYRMAKEAFENDGRKILDATINGNLTIFDKVDYNSLF